MFPIRSLALLSLTALLGIGCATGGELRPTENRFYKNPHVRRCLQLDKERRESEAQACWAQLLRTLETDAAFRQKSELSDTDLGKVRQMVGQSADRSLTLRRELDDCLNISSKRRDERMACFDAYLKRHRDRLSVGERYEVETAITEMKQARELASGNVENTVEHAAKMLGAEMHIEDDGLRIDAVNEGPMAQAGCPEQGLIVGLDDSPISEFDLTERIARLESCQDRPVQMLIRQGDNDRVSFLKVECSCGPDAHGSLLWKVDQPLQTCTTSGNWELRLGISWCYLAAEGLLEVEEVCKGSPADAAGVNPDQRYMAINGRYLLGMTFEQIGALLASAEGQPISLAAKGGALASPAPLSAKLLDGQQAERFWKALKRTLEPDPTERNP